MWRYWMWHILLLGVVGAFIYYMCIRSKNGRPGAGTKGGRAVSMLEHEGDFSKELGVEWIDKSARQEGGPATL